MKSVDLMLNLLISKKEEERKVLEGMVKVMALLVIHVYILIFKLIEMYSLYMYHFFVSQSCLSKGKTQATLLSCVNISTHISMLVC